VTLIPRPPFPVDLSEVATVRVPFLVRGVTVVYFDGDPDKVFIQESEDPTSTLARDAARSKKERRWDHDVQLYIVNTQAQAGKRLELALLGPGDLVVPGAHASQLSDANRNLINPATKDNQDLLLDTLGAKEEEPTQYTAQDRLKGINDRLGEVDESPTENTLLERLKKVEDSTAALVAAHTNKGDLVYNQVTVGTSQVQLSAASVPVADGYAVAIKALQINAGNVYVGKTGVLITTGFELDAKDAISLYVDDLNLLYVIADAADQGVCYIVEKVAA